MKVTESGPFLLPFNFYYMFYMSFFRSTGIMNAGFHNFDLNCFKDGNMIF